MPFLTWLCKAAICTLTLLLVVRCATDDFLIDPLNVSSAGLSPTTSDATGVTDCLSCTYVVPAGVSIIDGAILGIEPGSVIGLDANITYGALKFRNITGTPDQPIIIKNCGGTVTIDGATSHDALKTENSKHFRITGGNVDGTYGIVVTGARMGVNLGGLSTNFEVDHVKIVSTGFAGIMAKTDPGCDASTWRENFLMEDVALHHNYISDTGGEGIYAGNSFYMGMNTSCGVKYPHEIHNISIYSNILKNTGWDAIQLGCATRGASIHGNTIENYGVLNVDVQNSGIQIGAGTGGLCYNNLIRKGPGNGMGVFGIGDNVIFNNIIDQAGNFGIFCDERDTPGEGFKFLNNTILNSGSDGIRIYAELVPMNVIANNIIANPGSYTTHTYPRSPEDAFVYKLNGDVRIIMANNYFTTVTDSLLITDLPGADYTLAGTSPVVDKGADVSAYYDIRKDFYGHARVNGGLPDIGAVETGTPVPNISPVANAGNDKTVALPSTQVTLEGSGTDEDGYVVSYTWTQYGGEPVVLSNASSKTATVSGLKEGSYYFRITVEDDNGATDYDNMLVRVYESLSPSPGAPAMENTAPMAYAGPDLSLELPENTLTLSGSGRDKDGSVVQYTWTQYSGPAAQILDPYNPGTAVVFSVSGSYYFRLTVTDDDGATHYDNMMVKVTGALPAPNQPPTANAGPDRILTVPQNSLTLAGSGTDSDGAVITYSWIQYGGPAAVIINADTPTPVISGLIEGRYYFRLIVTDEDGATDYDNMLVRVNGAL